MTPLLQTLLLLAGLFFATSSSASAETEAVSETLRALRTRARQRAEKQTLGGPELDLLNFRFAAVADLVAEHDLVKARRQECRGVGLSYDNKLDECTP